MKEKHMCPVCGDYEFVDDTKYDFCPYCGWVNDLWQEENPLHGGIHNIMSLSEARIAWECGDFIE